MKYSTHPEAIKSRKWRSKNKSKSRKHVNSYQKKLRIRAIKALGKKCCKCGFDDERALQIDHINGGGSKDRGGKNTNIGWARRYNAIINNETNEFQLLCANCNFIKRHEEKELPYKQEQPRDSL